MSVESERRIAVWDIQPLSVQKLTVVVTCNLLLKENIGEAIEGVLCS